MVNLGLPEIAPALLKKEPQRKLIKQLEDFIIHLLILIRKSGKPYPQTRKTNRN